jgi:hypothetical protein
MPCNLDGKPKESTRKKTFYVKPHPKYKKQEQNELFLVQTRVARWYIFKPKILIRVYI